MSGKNKEVRQVRGGKVMYGFECQQEDFVLDAEVNGEPV